MNTLDRALRGVRNDWRLHLLSVFSVSVAFVCLVAALLVVVNVDRVHHRWQDIGRLSVYLHQGTTTQQTTELERALRATPGVQGVRVVSSAAARRELLHDFTDDAIAALPEQAFPTSLDVRTVEGLAPAGRRQMVAQLKNLASVESVESYDQWGKRLGSALAGGVTAALLLAIVVLAAVVSVVSSTMRLSLQRRRIEVEVLKLVGATNNYVRRPFLLEGAAQGASGAILALSLVAVLYGIVRSSLDVHLAGLLGVTPSFLPWSASVGMVLLGAILGVVAAHLSLSKMLLL